MVLQPVSSVLNGFVLQHIWFDISDELEKVVRALKCIEDSLAEDAETCRQVIKRDKDLFQLRLQSVQDIAHEVLDLLDEWQRRELGCRMQEPKQTRSPFIKKRASVLLLASQRRRAPPALED